MKLTDEELSRYNQGELVERGKAKEGHRIYIAFHLQEFMKKLFREDTILEHTVEYSEKGEWIPQDVWIVRKNG